jgi:hypothetical protein
VIALTVRGPWFDFGPHDDLELAPRQPEEPPIPGSLTLPR